MGGIWGDRPSVTFVLFRPLRPGALPGGVARQPFVRRPENVSWRQERSIQFRRTTTAIEEIDGIKLALDLLQFTAAQLYAPSSFAMAMGGMLDDPLPTDRCQLLRRPTYVQAFRGAAKLRR